MAVSGNTLWLFGGLVEIGDKEIAFDDLWCAEMRTASVVLLCDVLAGWVSVSGCWQAVRVEILFSPARFALCLQEPRSRQAAAVARATPLILPPRRSVSRLHLQTKKALVVRQPRLRLFLVRRNCVVKGTVKKEDLMDDQAQWSSSAGEEESSESGEDEEMKDAD